MGNNMTKTYDVIVVGYVTNTSRAHILRAQRGTKNATCGLHAKILLGSNFFLIPLDLFGVFFPIVTLIMIYRYIFYCLFLPCQTHIT